ncbi:MAG: LytTR family transcriptional regulator DNA-binding domain-containing protein [Bacteroidales bacterium]|nr:LytTR family transcriptional regulator DNA-binding domain-containing protein [Bacteroidales bacterium]
MSTNYLILRGLDSWRRVPLSDIAFFETDNKSTFIVIKEYAYFYKVHKPLRAYEEKFKNHKNFIRISRNNIVNINYCREIITGTKPVAIMETGDRLKISRRRFNKVVKAFRNL